MFNRICLLCMNWRFPCVIGNWMETHWQGMDSCTRKFAQRTRRIKRSLGSAPCTMQHCTMHNASKMQIFVPMKRLLRMYTRVKCEEEHVRWICVCSAKMNGMCCCCCVCDVYTFAHCNNKLSHFVWYRNRDMFKLPCCACVCLCNASTDVMYVYRNAHFSPATNNISVKCLMFAILWIPLVLFGGTSASGGAHHSWFNAFKHMCNVHCIIIYTYIDIDVITSLHILFVFFIF